MKQAKGHTGYHGCEKCFQRGTWAGKMAFPDIDAELRTDERFKRGRGNTDPHHIGPVASPSLFRCKNGNSVPVGLHAHGVPWSDS